MATGSVIGILNEDGSVDAVYCHYDGYTSGVGLFLKEFYNNEEKVRDLLSYGAISSLQESLGKTQFFYQDLNDRDTINGEQYFRDVPEFINFANNMPAEYMYLFYPTSNEWKVSAIGQFASF